MNARGNSRGGGQARDHFDQGHQRRRVEEVHANHLVRALQPGGEAGDGQRRSVAGEDAVGGAQGFQLAEQRLLDLQVLDNGLDHQASIGQGFEGVYRAQPGAYGFPFGSLHLAFSTRRASCRSMPATAWAAAPGRLS